LCIQDEAADVVVILLPESLSAILSQTAGNDSPVLVIRDLASENIGVVKVVPPFATDVLIGFLTILAALNSLPDTL
jgi:Mg/Co/Ni transporter MgtE